MSSHGIESRDEKETSRIEAFSDGVFAIAATLLVLEIQVPKLLENGEEMKLASDLLPALQHLWPSFFGYFLGFATIIVMWINHHHMLTLVRRSTHALLLWNSLLLLFISLVPFPTALVAEYMGKGDAAAATVVAVIYCAMGFLIALCYNFLWAYISRGNRLIDPRSDPDEVRTVTRSYYMGPVFYLLALGVSFYNAQAGLIICALLIVFFALSPRTISAKINKVAGIR